MDITIGVGSPRREGKKVRMTKGGYEKFLAKQKAGCIDLTLNTVKSKYPGYIWGDTGLDYWVTTEGSLLRPEQIVAIIEGRKEDLENINLIIVKAQGY